MDTFTTIIVLVLAIILMFGFPLMSLADRNDDITQSAVQTATTEFTDNIILTGKLTWDEYNNFVTTLSATGNAYDVEIVFKILDENPAKKDAQAGTTVIDGNAYYSVYTTQIEEQLGTYSVYILKEGDIVSVSVKNRGLTLYGTLMNIYYKVTGNDTYAIYASWAGTVTANGE